MSRTPDDLALTWQQFDWRESLFAPGLVILQALTATGRTASGAGFTRGEAYARCLGETAECLALDTGSAARFLPQRDGIAAHPEAAVAQRHAMLEAVERHVISQWWLGQIEARPVSAAWLAAQKLAAEASALRKGAAQKRKTQWWQVAVASGPSVMICRGTSRSGQDPILGYGCDWDARRAAAKALREMLLMELNLMELVAARSGDAGTPSVHVQQRLAAFAQHGASILPNDHPVTPEAAPDTGSATPLDCHDVTPADCALPVWLCRPDWPAPTFPAPMGAPFL